MRVLWITNNPLPDACTALDLPVPVIEGWLHAGAQALVAACPQVQLSVASLYSGKKHCTVMVNGIQHYLLPKPRGYHLPTLGEYYRQVAARCQPNVVHIHGTEFPYGLAYIQACGSRGVVVSVQGLVSRIAQHYYAGIPVRTLLWHTTLRDWVRQDTVFHQRRSLQRRGRQEMATLQLADHVIGRTAWDKAAVASINPRAHYHHANETLRPSFYEGEWQYNHCEKWSLFMSQGHYPIKGLHQVLRALPLVLCRYPSARLYVAGHHFVDRPWWRLSGYACYIRRLLQEGKLEDKVIFTGALPAEAMRQRYLQSHLFLCPSSIENSSNSVGEAQLLGVPVVAANVSGMPSMVNDGVSGWLYPFADVEALVERICCVFEMEGLVEKISDRARKVSRERNCREGNGAELLTLYLSLKTINRIVYL